MHVLIIIPFIIFNFLFVPFSVYITFSKFLCFSKDKRLFILIISLSLAQSLLSLLLNYLLIFFPGRPNIFYSGIIGFIFVTPFFFTRKISFKELNPFIGLKTKLFEFSLIEIILLITFIGLSISLFFLSFIKPLIANDPLLYFEMSRYIFHEKDILIYPFFEPYQNGYYGPSWHPPAYHGLLVWSYIFQGNATYTYLGQLFAPLSPPCCCL